MPIKLTKNLRMKFSVSNACITLFLSHPENSQLLFKIRRNRLDLSMSLPLMVMLKLERIILLSKVYLNSLKVNIPKHSMLELRMTITGSQMRISSCNCTIQTLSRSLLDRILERELLLLMMISQVRFASKTLRVLRYHQRTHSLRSPLLERMEVME